MKKFISLLLTLVLAFSCFAVLTACKGGEDEPADDSAKICDTVKTSSPTKIVTVVTYTDAKGEDLGGKYTTMIQGEDSIFEYEYRRYRTPEEGVADGSTEPIKTLTGKIYYKDHTYSAEGDQWDASTAVSADIKLDLQLEYLTSPTVSEDGTTLTATLTSENATKVLGTDLAAQGEISITVVTNGTNLTGIVLSCTTKTGAEVIVRTSYSYNPIELEFPKA